MNTSLLDTYVKAYYADAAITQLLPTENYEVEDTKVMINKGSVKSNDAKFHFKNLNTLDRELVYVLPVSVHTSDVSLLGSASNYFFVFRAGALINVVTDMSKNYLTVKWTSDVTNMSQITLTYDATTTDWVIYVNGKVQSSGKKSLGNLNIKGNGRDRDFLIGKSYDDNRWFEGYMSEVRVWNVVRTQQQIQDNIYYVDPQTEGLVGYWKMDDNTTTVKVVDATCHGNDAIANTPLSFFNVSLPEKK